MGWDGIGYLLGPTLRAPYGAKKYGLQVTFYCPKYCKKVPINCIEIQVKGELAVKSSSVSDMKSRSLFTSIRLFNFLA